MTIGELRAFIEGMDIKEAPTPDQWARIAEKMATVHAAPLAPVTVPSIWPITTPSVPHWPNDWTVTSYNGAAC